LDDWETAHAYEKNRSAKFYLNIIPHLYYVNSLSWKLVLENLCSFADEVTVSNTFLRKRMGGSVIVHARNTETFDPSLYSNNDVKRELGLPRDKTIAMFTGTPRPHKGVESLIEAQAQFKNDNLITVIVGDDDSRYSKKLKKTAGRSVVFCGRQPFKNIPKWIAACDIFIVPQRNTLANRGQIPAKVFDAMAMAKPVIATEVGDLPRVLDGCGIIVDPESPRAIADAIESLHVNLERRKALGNAARKRCVEQYSYKALAPKLKDIVLSVAS
jgi:glycosyltransferase involved in cell wall biosynthesis